MHVIRSGGIFNMRNSLFSAPFQVPEVSRDQSQHVDGGPEIGDPDLPIFEQTAPNVTAFVGQTVYLPCRVRNLGDKVVSDFHYCPSDLPRGRSIRLL